MAHLDQPATLPLSPIAAAQPPQPPQPDLPPNSSTAASQPPPSTDSLGKRQRRPSVRLGEIGDQTPPVLAYEPNPSRSKHWRLPKDSNKSSKTRPLTNLVQNGDGDCHQNQTLDVEDRNFSGEGQSEFGSMKLSTKKGTVRRAKTNWSSKLDDRDDEFEAADGPLNDTSPVHSIDNETLSFWNRRPVRARVSDNELDNMHHESDSRDRKCDSSADGVTDWLIGLGLGRYAPVFEIHEVDDEVLPLLTLDDLKDMGINAVGSRRKMYTAIQKLRKGFS